MKHKESENKESLKGLKKEKGRSLRENLMDGKVSTGPKGLHFYKSVLNKIKTHSLETRWPSRFPIKQHINKSTFEQGRKLMRLPLMLSHFC